MEDMVLGGSSTIEESSVPNSSLRAYRTRATGRRLGGTKYRDRFCMM